MLWSLALSPQILFLAVSKIGWYDRDEVWKTIHKNVVIFKNTTYIINRRIFPDPCSEPFKNFNFRYLSGASVASFLGLPETSCYYVSLRLWSLCISPFCKDILNYQVLLPAHTIIALHFYSVVFLLVFLFLCFSLFIQLQSFSFLLFPTHSITCIYYDKNVVSVVKVSLQYFACSVNLGFRY